VTCSEIAITNSKTSLLWRYGEFLMLRQNG
jgi:hypothetical protein